MYDYTSTSSWTVVVSAIILIGATYLVPGHQPTTLRPFTTDQASARPLFPDSVQARLWLDPIEAGWQHIRSFSPVDKGKDENIPDKLWDEWEKAPDTLQSRIDSNAKSVFYLPIVLSGKPYPESRERLLRSRFAFLLSQNASSKLCTLVQGFSCYTGILSSNS